MFATRHTYPLRKLIFLKQNTIYQYDPVLETFFLREETLLDGKGSFGMVLVDENSLNC